MTFRAAAFSAFAIFAVASSPEVRAQDASREEGAGELELFQLDATLAQETTVASRRARTIRETPGVVTVLSREEILATGARDLADLLVRVPGFQFGVDVEGAVGVGFRGIWGHEGKVLLLVDGFEMNDLAYGTFPFGSHILLDQVESVEIIRGPGSAAYGGHAELAVVNVVTRAARVEGASVSSGGGRMADATSLVYGTAAAGIRRGDFRAGAVASLGDGTRSDLTYTDVYGSSYGMAIASAMNPGNVSVHAAWRGLSLRFLYDDYRTTSGDNYGWVTDPAEKIRWATTAADLRWDLRVNDRLTITPRLTYMREVPWQQRDVADAQTYFDTTAERTTGRVAAAWDPVPQVSVLGGVEAYVESARLNDPANGLYDYMGKRSLSYVDYVAFGEVGLDTRFANVLAGARFERHEEFGNAFVPRLAVTRVFGPAHVKLLASGAYRTPSIENIHYAAPGVTIIPERTTVYEAEVGWQLSRYFYAAANVFDVTIKKPIVFGYDPSSPNVDSYTNEGSTGSRGVELDLRFQLPIGTANVGYSFYTASGKNHVLAYDVEGHPGLLLGFAGHKVVAAAQLRVWKDLVLSPTVVFLSDRYYDAQDSTTGDVLRGKIGSRTLVDLFAAWRDLGVKGLEVGLGVRNAFDQRMEYIQPYSSYHAPLPGATREVTMRIRYDT